MSGDVHVQFCERPGVRFPRATHLRQGGGPGVAPSVGDDDRRSGQLVAVGKLGNPLALEHGAPAAVELAGLPTLDERFRSGRAGGSGGLGCGA